MMDVIGLDRLGKIKKIGMFAVVILCFALFASAARAAKMPGDFPAFSSVNLDGQPVSGDIFAGKTLTMVNIWATWCPPCIREMPDLGNMGRSMPEGSQLIGLVVDYETIDEVKKILSGAKADFLQILPSEEMKPVLSPVDAIPTTIFVDANGKIVGDPLVGSRSEADYRAVVEKLLAESGESE